jgi:hypothetical protein
MLLSPRKCQGVQRPVSGSRIKYQVLEEKVFPVPLLLRELEGFSELCAKSWGLRPKCMFLIINHGATRGVCQVALLGGYSLHLTLPYALWKEAASYGPHLRSGDVCSPSSRKHYLHKLFGILLHGRFISVTISFYR